MKKLNTLVAIVILLSVTYKARAQDGFDQLIKSTPADATKLVDAFAKPLFKGFGVGLNSGWNNTAKTKGFLHFDLRISATAAQAPVMDRSFDVTRIGLSNHVTLDNSSTTRIAPTFAGDKNAATPIMRINDDAGNKVSNFTMPNGVIQYVPAPNIQLTVGLLKNTDLTIRTTPTIKISDDAGSVGTFGFGIKHDFIQDFAKNIPKPFDLAIAVNYNRLKYTKGLNVQPDNGATPAPGQSAADFSNQRLSATFNALNVQAILSKKLLFFTPFISVGYQNSTTDLGVLGNFPLSSTTIGQTNRYVVVTDPIHINETSLSGMRGDIGFQMNLTVFRIYASYSVGGGYNSANGGIGFGF